MTKKSSSIGASSRASTTVVAASRGDLSEQRAYEERMRSARGNFSVTIGKAFILGMRQQGYRNTALAIDEFIDNAIQAGATRADVVFGFERASKENQPTALAIIDNAHGMDGGMIRLAMTWGGSHRADRDDRSGFGRFGFGLPTAALSQGLSYTVISRTEGPFRSVTFDVGKLAQYASTDGGLEIPKDVPCVLPRWLEDYVDSNFAGLPHGTIVLLESLDNLTWKTTAGLETNISRHLGLQFRNFLGDVSLNVNGNPVKMIDPLFLAESALFHDCPDGLRAEALPEQLIPVKDALTGKEKGVVRVRYSFMPYGFAAGTDYRPDGTAEEKTIKSGRFQILKEHRGIIALRHGRQIGVLEPPRDKESGWFDLIPADVHWGCEIDFPATLDEEFGVTTTKQGARPSQRMWDILAQADVRGNILQMRYKRRGQARNARANAEPEAIVERVMMEITPKKRRPYLGDDANKISRANAMLKREVERRALAAGVSKESVELRIQEEIERRPYVMERESANDGPFFRLEPRGGQRRLILNSDHPFCGFYDALDKKMRLLCLLLIFVIADAEMDAIGTDTQTFYAQERSYWSHNLKRALDRIREAGYADESGEGSAEAS